MRAFGSAGKASKEEPITIIQIDQHIDWRQEVERRSSRVSPASSGGCLRDGHVGEIFQIGLRASGSARPAGGRGRASLWRASDHRLRTARCGHGCGSCDASPTAGATTSPSTWTAWTAPSRRPWPLPCRAASRTCRRAQLIHGLVRKGRVVGMDVVEITPKHDINKITYICRSANREHGRTDRSRGIFCEALTVFFVGNGSCEWTL